jgi:hypothetical protein
MAKGTRRWGREVRVNEEEGVEDDSLFGWYVGRLWRKCDLCAVSCHKPFAEYDFSHTREVASCTSHLR